MGNSGALRGRKPEAVQFWLAIVAVSLLFHALLIVGIKRWATIEVVEPDADPISVELVDPAGPESMNTPIVPAAALKPEVKPEANPEVQLEPEPEIKPEFGIKPEPEVKPEVKPEARTEIKNTQPPIASTPKPDRSPVPLKKNTPSRQSGQSQSPELKKDLTRENQNSSPKESVSASQSDDLLGNPGSGGGGSNLAMSLAQPVLRSTSGEIGGRGTAKLKLNFPTSIPFPATFALRAGEVIRAKVRFVVVGNDIQSPEVKELQPKLSGRDQDALLQFIDDVVGQISVDEIVIDTDANKKPDTYWETTIELRL